MPKRMAWVFFDSALKCRGKYLIFRWQAGDVPGGLFQNERAWQGESCRMEESNLNSWHTRCLDHRQLMPVSGIGR